MVRFKKRGAREIVWGPEEPWVEPKKEVILGPAGIPSDITGVPSSENASALGFLGEMAGAAEPSSISSSDSSTISSSNERPRSSPYGYDPTESSSSGYSGSSSSLNQSSDSSSYSGMSSDHTERLERLHRKLDRTIERIEEIEKKDETSPE